MGLYIAHKGPQGPAIFLMEGTMPKKSYDESTRGGFLRKLIEASGLSENDVCQISGVSTAYLHALLNNKITKVGKDNLLLIAFALDLQVPENINELFNKYGIPELSDDDDSVDLIIKASINRKITGIQPLYRYTNIDLLLIKLYELPGDAYMINSRLSSVFSPEGYSSFKKKKAGITKPIYIKIGEQAVRKQREYLDMRLKQFKVDYLICHHCMINYINEINLTLSKEENNFRINQFKMLFNYLINKPNYKLTLTEVCPNLRFALKKIPKTKKFIEYKNERDKLFFVGSEVVEGKSTDGYLYGFASDSKKLFIHFEKEYKRLKNNPYMADDSPEKLISYLKDLLKKRGVEDWD